MKILHIYILIAVLTVTSAATAYSTTKEQPAPQVKTGIAAPNAQAVQRPPVTVSPIAPNITMVVGSISKIDDSDPKNINLAVKGTKDNQVHTVQIMPGTSITKIIKTSDLKNGDNVRIYTRKVQDKDVAAGVIVGAFEVTPNRPSATPGPLAQLQNNTPPAPKAAQKK